MLSRMLLFSFVTVGTALLSLSAGVQARTMHGLTSKHMEAVQRLQARNANLNKRVDGSLPPTPSPQLITFKNPAAANFLVDGGNIPEVDWNVGPSWAGLLPISGNKDETRKLFFWFFPPAPQGSADDIIFWTNGGPGCSSLEGFLQENGPISWGFGQAKPTQNQFSWTNLSSVLWVEQPVGTGYSQGKPNITNEFDLAAQLVGFMEQFLNVFSELKGKNLWLSGESYAGYYIPYIADYINNHPDSLDLNLQGTWLGAPVIGWNTVASDFPAANFIHEHQSVLGLNQSFVQQIDARAQQCGYTDFMNKFLRYPPPAGPFPLLHGTVPPDECSLWNDIFIAAFRVNPAFNIYRIFDMYPILWDVLGFPGSFFQAQTLPLYFDRKDVKRALHVPTTIVWEECSSQQVFPNGDQTLPSSMSVLPSVIEKSKSGRTVVMHGLADFAVLAEGTRVAIQNMTWGGMQGFQTQPEQDSLMVDALGVSLGSVHTERGLTYYEVALSGHMIPQFSPWTAFQSMQYLMGRRDRP